MSPAVNNDSTDDAIIIMSSKYIITVMFNLLSNAIGTFRILVKSFGAGRSPKHRHKYS